jgi:excisionase family DNA binding protein
MKDNPNIMNVEEAAAYVQISIASMYRLLQQRQIPGAFKVGSSHRIRKDILDEKLSVFPEAQPEKLDRRFKRKLEASDRPVKG